MPLVGKILKKVFRVNNANRYRNLFELIRHHRCKRLLEIGTYDGIHAVQMIESAKQNFPSHSIEYYGIDLFELIDENKLQKEYIGEKIPPPYNYVKSSLERTGARIFLFKGDTRIILPQIINQMPPMDFMFIDGGHSVDTIKNDWHYVKKLMTQETIVVFDDYWNINEAGCKQIIDSLDRSKYEVEILSPKDKFWKDWGTLEINMVKVRKMRAHGVQVNGIRGMVKTLSLGGQL